MKQEKYCVEYFLDTTNQKGKIETEELGNRNIFVKKNGICKEALAFRWATMRQLQANRLRFTRLQSE